MLTFLGAAGAFLLVLVVVFIVGPASGSPWWRR